MHPKENNFAYIDGANLHKGIIDLGWNIDYSRFRRYLFEKYSVNKAYIFLGFISSNTHLYRDLQDWGYTVVFKPTIPNGCGEIKGNCDSGLVLQAVSDMYEKCYDRCVIVSGDGDFACLVLFLKEKARLKVVVCPNHKKASVLLRRASSDIVFLERLKERLDRKRNDG
ncbi:MAG: NYN domain-containing protein [Candidatus Uhrbacteria bacterium]|nr:NYN domain-containing protein [Candidatus Uhrbacteria bacterium]